MKPKVLLVGDHPYSFSGNGHMIFSLAMSVDREKYDVRIFAATPPVLIPDYFEESPIQIIEGIEGKTKMCGDHLCNILATNEIDVVVFVGLDCWVYQRVFSALIKLHKEKKFIWCSIFPYDLHAYRPDWELFINAVDFPYVYSEYGYNALREKFSHVRYFRPMIFNVSQFFEFEPDVKEAERQTIFSSVSKDTFIFGFVGNNQFRKDPQRMIKAFFEVKKEYSNCILYMHTEATQGPFNLATYIIDCGGRQGDVYLKQDGLRFENIAKIYNSIDCLVNTSLQEGLSWTLLEAMLCGCPVIAADNTAQSELIRDGAGIAVPCTELAFLPLMTPQGQTYVESYACSVEKLKEAMLSMIHDNDLRAKTAERGKERATNWVKSNVSSNINEVIETALEKKKVVYTSRKKSAVLFVQHSSAGDVLMTTQCFKGIKEKHKNKPLVYMTQKQFIDIIKGNPYIDDIIEWDDSALSRYEIVYNPHGEHILKGRFNRLDATLYSLYPYFCKVEPDKMFIECIDPGIELPEKYAVVHTTGGDRLYRTYPHMDFVVNKLNIPCVQIGAITDRVCKNVIDLRGKLSFRETAFVIKKAEVAIVVDSFPAHLAGCLGTPVVTLFGPAPARVTRPRADNGKSINIEADLLAVCSDLGGCWGSSIDNSCSSPCINTINPLIVAKAAISLIGG